MKYITCDFEGANKGIVAFVPEIQWLRVGYD